MNDNNSTLKSETPQVSITESERKDFSQEKMQNNVMKIYYLKVVYIFLLYLHMLPDKWYTKIRRTLWYCSSSRYEICN